MATPRSFFSMLAHELRNSLAPMRNGMQLLRLRGATDPAVLAAADIIDRQIANIIKLLEIAVDADQIRRGLSDG